MTDDTIEYKENDEQDEIVSDLKEMPVLSFDEELMDDFDESILEGEESIIDFVEEEEENEENLIIDELLNEQSSTKLLTPKKNIEETNIETNTETNTASIDNNITNNKTIIDKKPIYNVFNNYEKKSIINLTNENDFEDYDKIYKNYTNEDDIKDNNYEKPNDDDESFYNFSYTNKTLTHKQNTTVLEKTYAKPKSHTNTYSFSKLEDIIPDHYKASNIDKQIDSINKEGFYYFNNEEEDSALPKNTSFASEIFSIDNELIEAIEKEEDNIKNTSISKKNNNINDTSIKDEKKDKEQNSIQNIHTAQETNIHDIDELIEEIEKEEDNIENTIIENTTISKENGNINDTIIQNKEQKDKDCSLQKIASSINIKYAGMKYAGLSSYNTYKNYKIKNNDNEIKELLKYFNTLLKELPEDKKKQFISSTQHKLYNKICNRLGITLTTWA